MHYQEGVTLTTTEHARGFEYASHHDMKTILTQMRLGRLALSKATDKSALRPSAVVKQYAPLVGGPVQVREILAISLAEGTLQARAAHRWVSTEASLSKAWKNEPDKEGNPKPAVYGPSHQIPRSDWQKSLRLRDDTFLWNFSRSRLHVTICESPIKRIMLRDVRFFADDIKTIFRFVVNDGKSNFYRANKTNEWRRFWHELVIMAAQGKKGIKDSQLTDFSNDGEIIKAVQNRLFLDDSALSEQGISDDDAAELLNKRLPFSLSEDAILQEVKILRQVLGLKRRYTQRGFKLGLTEIGKSGSAGRTQ